MRKYLLFLIAIILISCNDNSTNPNNLTNDKLNNDALLEELNYARTNPNAYANILRDRINNFEGNIYKNPITGERIITNEGPTAYLEAINYLEKSKNMQKMSLSTGLSKAALAHCNDIGPKGLVQHNSSNGETPWDRMAKYGKPDGKMGENIAFGSKTARDVIVDLIVDDGVPSRGHRANIFTESFKCVGFGIGYHKIYEIMVVMDFADNYKELVIFN